MPARIDRDHWERRLAELAGKFNVPGAAVGIAYGDETVEFAYGVTNVDTGVEATTDTLFQIGSMSKVWTATAIMRLVDDGRLDLDEPVVTYLPELSLADEQAQRGVTMRHLLNHTSGIDGDFFRDTGRGDECLERYVDALAGLPQNHPLGGTWSYCNSGFVVAGRVIERITGQVWDAAMRELVLTPLGLEHSVTLPEEALLFRTAVGHVHERSEEPKRAPVWMLPRPLGPAGLIVSTVADVLTFARLHLSGGLAADGARLLSEASVAQMQAEEVVLPDPYSLGDSWGLGWFRVPGSGGARFVGHDGNTIGQAAFLRLLPEQNMAVTMLTNGGVTRELYETLVREIFREIAGVELQEPLTPPDPPVEVDIAAYAGTYERTGARIEVFAAEDGPRLRLTSTQDLEGLPEEPEELELVPVRDALFLTLLPGAETWFPVTFYELSDGTPYVHFGARTTPKVG